jgi:hypothetical protein
MSSRSDAVRVTEGADAPAESVRLLPPTRLGCLLATVLLASLTACGGGGGESNQFIVNVTTSGVAPLSAGGLYGGEALFAVQRSSDSSTVQSESINSSGNSQVVVNTVPVGTSLKLVLTRHPRNQLCTLSAPALQVGQSAGSARLDCVPAILNDTGVTSCATSESERPGLCSAQDHQSGRDAERARLNRLTTDADLKRDFGFDYTRICNNGQPDGSGSGCQLGAAPVPGAVADQWGCTRDNATGLVWLIRDVPVVTYRAQEIPNTIPANLNRSCDLTDWALPTAAELASLIHSGRATSDPALNVSYLPNLGDPDKQRFWTATQVRGANNVYVDFSSNGRVVSGADAEDKFYVVWVSRQQATRLQNAVLPNLSGATRFAASSDGAVLTDSLTGLAWSVCSQGRGAGSIASPNCTGQAGGYSWEDALREVQEANQARRAGYSNWRLPTRAELASLLDYTSLDGVLLNAAVPQAFRDDSAAGGQGVSYWTSTAVSGPNSPSCGARTRPFQVNFGEGSVSTFPEDCPDDALALKLRVRLVRDAR